MILNLCPSGLFRFGYTSIFQIQLIGSLIMNKGLFGWLDHIFIYAYETAPQNLITYNLCDRSSLHLGCLDYILKILGDFLVFIW